MPKSSKYQTLTFNKALNKIRSKIILDNVTGKSCLEIGAGYGHITKDLMKRFSDLVVIEPDPECFATVPSTEKYCCTFEDFNIDKKFDTIVCSNVLEHVYDQISFLKKAKQFGKPTTKYIFIVPNAISYNRLTGVDMGMLNCASDLSAQDIEAGHKRMYYPKSLKDDLELAGYEVIDLSTYCFKPFHNYLMDRLESRIKNHCFKMRMKDNGAEILAICRA